MILKSSCLSLCDLFNASSITVTSIKGIILKCHLMKYIFVNRRGKNLLKHVFTRFNLGQGKSTYPLSANANVLSAPLSAFRSNVNVNLLLQCYVFCSNVMLVCYQQVGRVGSGGGNGKYVGVNGKWVR